MSKLVENYLLQEAVGKGVYGQVYRAVHQKNQGVFAVKVIPKTSFRSNPKLQQLAINQINILSSINHRNIVRFVETLKTPNNFYFVYQYCNEGTLENLLKKRQFLKESEALLFFRQLLQAFKELNKNNIMHRDLKPDNIFLSDGVLKLGDFGFCKMLDVNMAQTMLGSPIYMAPQVLKEQIYTSKADIWSMGVVLFQMLFGYCPFQSNSIAELMNKLKGAEVNIPHQKNHISEQTQILIRKMLVKDQFKRIQWVDLFDFVIDDNGKIIKGCKKEFAIETLERYFFNDGNGNGNGNSYNAHSHKFIPNQNLRNQEKSDGSGHAPIKEIQSNMKRDPENKVLSSNSSRNIQSSNSRPQTSQFSCEDQEEKFKPFATQELKKNSSSDKSIQEIKIQSKDPSRNQRVFSSNQIAEISVKSRTQSNESPPKIKKDKFGQKHTQWLQAISLLEDLALNSIDPNSEEICIVILLKKILQTIEKNCESYPEWTDVLIEEKKGIRDSLSELRNANPELSKFLDDQKENDQGKRDRNELLKIWNGARNKFTLQRAIRAAYERQSKETSVEEILA